VLTPISSFATGGRVPAEAVLNPQGTLLFAPNAASGTVAVYRVENSGVLTAAAGSPFNAGSDTVPISVALHPSKNFLYTTNSFVYSTPSVASLSAFQLDPSTGVLTPIAGSPFTTNGTSANPARIHPTGKFLYVSNRFSHNIQAYAIDPTSGALTNVPGSPFATGLIPSGVEIDTSGRFLFVANTDSHNVSAYVIDGTTGALTLIHSVPAGTSPTSVELVGLAPQ
jgi:6-phosphogluconolactonase (cycloisomerase 2 family)